ncbi:MAG: hypothetical protein WC244_00120 [Patescibacteria group bacterium]|jgi:hypothetical protein
MVNQAFNVPKAPESAENKSQPKSPQSGGKKTLVVALLVAVVVLLLAVGAMAGYLIYKINSSPAQNNSDSSDWQNTASTTNQTSTSATTTPANSEITWNAPQSIASLKLFKAMDGFDPEANAKYYKVGLINSGKYQGGEIILVSSPLNGPALYPGFYRFIKQGDSLVYLKNNSDELYPADSGADTSKFTTDENYKISELNSPESFIGSQPKQIFTLDKYVNAFFSLNDLKKSFTDSKLGDVYTSAYYNPTNNDLFGRNGFYIQAPDGTVRVYSLKLDIMPADSNVPRITWTDGKANATDYSYTDRTGCGSGNYASVIPGTLIESSYLKIVGKTAAGDDVYELKDSNNSLLKDFYNDKYQVFDGQKKVSYATFVASHPMFFWYDSFGRLIKFESSKYQPLAECGKPVIYLYPTTAQNISVKVEPQGGMSYSDPLYGNGWNVFSDTNSNLTELSSGKKYPYLFWEGSGGIYEQPKKGFVIKQLEVHNFLVSKLAQLGLNTKETADFMEFWEPRMQGSSYYFVTFLGTSEMNKIAPLTIVPKPDTVIRILMDFSPLENPIKVDGYNIKTPIRNGFTVVEWGGVLR